MQPSVPGYRFQPRPNQRSVLGIYNDAGEEVPLAEFLQAQRNYWQSQARARSATPQPSRGGGVRSRANNLTSSLIGGA